MATVKPFPHRLNQDGSYDSICPYCYMTVASHKFESSLGRFEQEHQCFGDFAMRKHDLMRETDQRISAAEA